MSQRSDNLANCYQTNSASTPQNRSQVDALSKTGLPLRQLATGQLTPYAGPLAPPNTTPLAPPMAMGGYASCNAQHFAAGNILWGVGAAGYGTLDGESRCEKDHMSKSNSGLREPVHRLQRQMHALARLGSLQLQQGQQQIHQQNGVVFPQRQCYGIGASVNGVSAVRAAELTDGVYCRTSSASPALGQVATSPDANFRSLTPKTDTSSCGGGPNNSLYKTELCRQWKEKKTCPYEERCQFAHGLEELRRVPRHPKYRTEKCRSFHMKGLCDYGPRCHFVHNYDKDSSRGEGLSLEGGKSSDGSPSFQSDTSPPLGTLLVSTQMSSTIYCAPPSNVNMASQILAPGANMAPQASPPSTEMSTSGSATQWNSGGSCNSVGHSASNSPPIGVVTITGTTVNPVNNCPPDFVAGDLPLKLAQLLATSEKDGIQPSYRNPGYGSPNQSANVSDGCNTVAYGNEVEASAKRLDVFRRLTGTRS